jgi:hypothetical protein
VFSHRRKCGTLQLPTITADLTITGPGAGVLTVSGNSAVRFFNIVTGVTVSISGLTISNGRAATSGFGGGGINNAGNLTITNSTLSGNSTLDSLIGGGILNNPTGELTVINRRSSGAIGHEPP